MRNELQRHLRGNRQGLVISLNADTKDNMSKIKEVTDFMKYEVADMQKQAEAVHNKAQKVKANFGLVLDSCYTQLDETDKELMELQAAMGMSSNNGPLDGGQTQ